MVVVVVAVVVVVVVLWSSSSSPSPRSLPTDGCGKDASSAAVQSLIGFLVVPFCCFRPLDSGIDCRSCGSAPSIFVARTHPPCLQPPTAPHGAHNAAGVTRFHPFIEREASGRRAGVAGGEGGRGAAAIAGDKRSSSKTTTTTLASRISCGVRVLRVVGAHCPSIRVLNGVCVRVFVCVCVCNCCARSRVLLAFLCVCVRVCLLPFHQLYVFAPGLQLRCAGDEDDDDDDGDDNDDDDDDDGGGGGDDEMMMMMR